MGAFWIPKEANFFYVDNEDKSVCAHAQANIILCWGTYQNVHFLTLRLSFTQTIAVLPLFRFYYNIFTHVVEECTQTEHIFVILSCKKI